MAISFHMIWTLTLLVVFVGIFYWAWSDRRKDDFEEASRLPLEADEQFIITSDNDFPNGKEKPENNSQKTRELQRGKNNG